MRVTIRKVDSEAKEQVVLECVTLSEQFADIQNYCLSKDHFLIGYDGNIQRQITYHEILYFEALEDKVFAYTRQGVYEMKRRLYELEDTLYPYHFVRCSKAFIIHLHQVDSIRPALNGRYYARMVNGEDVMISRKYARHVKRMIMEG